MWNNDTNEIVWYPDDDEEDEEDYGEDEGEGDGEDEENYEDENYGEGDGEDEENYEDENYGEGYREEWEEGDGEDEGDYEAGNYGEEDREEWREGDGGDYEAGNWGLGYDGPPSPSSSSEGSHYDYEWPPSDSFGVGAETVQFPEDEFKSTLEIPPLGKNIHPDICLLYTSPSPRDLSTSRMPSSA